MINENWVEGKPVAKAHLEEYAKKMAHERKQKIQAQKQSLIMALAMVGNEDLEEEFVKIFTLHLKKTQQLP